MNSATQDVSPFRTWNGLDSFELFPGVRLNLSKSGLSTSIGRPGATVNFGKLGTRYTVGLEPAIHATRTNNPLDDPPKLLFIFFTPTPHEPTPGELAYLIINQFGG